MRKLRHTAVKSLPKVTGWLLDTIPLARQLSKAALNEHSEEQFNQFLYHRIPLGLWRDSPRGHSGVPWLSTFFHKVTLRASAPQNTLWETLLWGAVEVKPVRVESTLAKKLLYYWENRSVTSRLGITEMEFIPSQGILESHTHPPNLSLLTIGLQLLEPHNVNACPLNSPP